MGAENTGYILIVEDDPGTWRLEEESLKELGLPLKRAATAEEAEAAIRAGPPALLVLDYCLPGASAAELLAKLRAAGAAVPHCVLVSGAPDDDLQEQARECRADSCVTKDCRFLGNLLEAARKALACGAGK